MNTTINIQNLKCGGCANTIITKLSELKNISAVTVNNETDAVSFNYTNEDDLNLAKDTLARIGYPTVGDKNSVLSKAKSFVSCASGRINKS